MTGVAADLLNQRRMITKFYRKKNRPGYAGLVVAVKDGDSVRVGWSLCKTKLDSFDRQKAYDLALARVNSPGRKNRVVPQSLKDTVDQVMDRAKKYFKTENVTV